MKTKLSLLLTLFLLQAYILNGQVKYVHSTFGNNPKTDINISWVTADTTDTSSYVLYGETTSYGMKSYNQRELIVLKDTGAYPRINMVHHIKLTGLTPGTRYHYKCGGDNGLSGDCTFKTAPEGNVPFTFAVIGDPQVRLTPASVQRMRECANFIKEIDTILNNGLSFVISLGDNVETDDLILWDTLFDRGQPMYENIIHMPILGGASHDGDGTNFTGFFKLPDNGFSELNANRSYRFEYANSFFANFDIQPPSKPITWPAYQAMRPWIDTVFNKTTKPVKFVSWHDPLWISSGSYKNDILAEIDTHKIVAVFSAHTHAYGFTYPIQDVSSIIDTPVIFNPATINGSGPGMSALINHSQGTVYYEGGSVAISNVSNQFFNVHPDSLSKISNCGNFLCLLATVYNDSVVFRVVHYRNEFCYPSNPNGKKGNAYFTYKIIIDNPGKKFDLNVSVSGGNGTTNPSGTVQYNANDDASVTAIPDGGYLFDNWTGDVTAGKENDNPLAVKMDTNKTLVAHFKVAPVYTLTVNSGIGSGNYAVGIQVPIAANAPAAGKVFDKWTGDVAGVANVNASSTTITMPSANAAVTATYKDAPPSFTLTVNEGTGSGSYTAGIVVTITANTAPVGQVFDKWTGDITGIANVNTSTTSITMPSANAVITATFKDITNAIASEKSMVSIFPNPATDVLNVLSSFPIDEIKVADLTGKIIMIESMAGKNSTTLSLIQLEKGMYIIDIKLSSGNVIQKTFIVR